MRQNEVFGMLVLADEQYSRRACLEISDVPESVTDNDLEGEVLNLLEKIDVEVHPDNIESCHWMKSNAGPKKLSLKCNGAKMQIKFERQRKI